MRERESTKWSPVAEMTAPGAALASIHPWPRGNPDGPLLGMEVLSGRHPEKPPAETIGQSTGIVGEDLRRSTVLPRVNKPGTSELGN
jgi:hypothetical protein